MWLLLLSVVYQVNPPHLLILLQFVLYLMKAFKRVLLNTLYKYIHTAMLNKCLLSTETI